MSLVGHIVRKDLFRLKWILLLWALVLAAGLGLATVQAGLDGDTFFPFWVATKVVVVGFLPLLAFGSVMGLFHDDPVAELDAFWITRPISGTALLAAKALTLLLFMLVPIVVMLPFWLARDYTGGQVARAVLQTMEGHGLIILAALPFAVLSANASKFVMHVMVGAGGLLLMIILGNLGQPRTTTPAVPGLILARSCVIAGLWLAATLVMIMNQFLWRRTRRSVVVALAAAALGFAVAKWWPWTMGLSREGRAESVAALAPGAPKLTVRITGASRQVAIVGQVPLRESAVGSRRGLALKIQSVFADYTGELQVAFSEASPQLDEVLGDWLPGASKRTPAPAWYFLLNPADHRLLAVSPARVGNELPVATVVFSHAAIRVRASGNWQTDAPPDFRAWLRDAWLLKVIDPASPPIASSSAP